MAMFFVSRTTPPLDALYTLPPAVPSSPSMLASVTTEPRWPSACRGCCSIWPMTCFAVRNVPVRLIEMTRSHSSAGSMCTGPPPATPAALTSPSMLPPEPKPTAARTRSATDCSSVTSTSLEEPPILALRNRSGGLHEVGSHDTGPLVEEAVRRRPTDARGGSGHDVGPAVQSTHGASVWLRPGDPGCYLF